MSRSLPEWLGKNDDTPVPDRVRLRVLQKLGCRCAKCLNTIPSGMRWICDHIVALINNGENRESNLQALCKFCAPQKDRADVAEKSRSYRSRKRHYGVRKTKTLITGWTKFDGTPVWNPKLKRRRS